MKPRNLYKIFPPNFSNLGFKYGKPEEVSVKDNGQEKQNTHLTRKDKTKQIQSNKTRELITKIIILHR